MKYEYIVCVYKIGLLKVKQKKEIKKITIAKSKKIENEHIR